MIENRKFVVEGTADNYPFVLPCSREPAPGMTLTLTLINLQDDALFVRVLQSANGTDWQELGLTQMRGLGIDIWPVSPSPGRKVRFVFWTTRGGRALVQFQAFERRRSASA